MTILGVVMFLLSMRRLHDLMVARKRTENRKIPSRLVENLRAGTNPQIELNAVWHKQQLRGREEQHLSIGASV